MKIVAIIQARLSSARLPGKVLAPLHGRPLLAYVIEGLRQCATLDGVLLATSTDETDDPIEAFAISAGVDYYRGPLDDVAARMLEAARRAECDVFVRVSGDSPLLDPALVDRAVAMCRSAPTDLVTNVARRTFPRGQSVEVVAARALATAIEAMTTAAEREHVTVHFYQHPDKFSIRSFEAEHPRPDVQLSVDDATDLARCEAILDALGEAPWRAGWEACVRAHDALLSRRLG